MSVRILHGDSRVELRAFDDCSVDSVATDPPYALVSIGKRFGADGAAPAKVGATGAYARASAGFMGQKWDTGETAFDPEFWREVLRVLKPGGHAVVFGGTRTYHRMACAIEDAGFEIRDMVSWIYGSGFPKSHNVSKGIDRARKDNAEWQTVGAWLRARREIAGFKQRDVAVLWPSATGGLTGCVANWELGLSCPKWDQWLQLKNFIGFGDEMDAEVWRLNGRKGTPGEAWQNAEVVGIKEGAMSGWSMDGETKFVDREVKAANSDAAREWQGWGTALKPALEPIVLARKPLSEPTVAANVLKWGTGALNIDGCRVATDDGLNGGGYDPSGRSKKDLAHATSYATKPIARPFTQPAGRWPANVTHDGSDEVVAAFPETAPSNFGDRAGGCEFFMGGDKRSEAISGFGDSGSAARFFYSAKADADDRMGSKHPTVKPVTLMRWLVRLITPKGGTVLDCFAGTGTTGIAAMSEGFNAILIEREESYVADIRTRIDHAKGEAAHTGSVKTRNKPEPKIALPLFGAA